jgi:hypothetical protein
VSIRVHDEIGVAVMPGVTGQRMERTQRALGITDPGSGGLFFVLHLVPIISLYAPVYLQQQLDRAWQAGMLAPRARTPELASH